MPRDCPTPNPQPSQPGNEAPANDPLSILISRTRAELSADFDFSKAFCSATAPGTLDIMGGVAEFTGSPVCRSPINRAAAVLLQQRADREIQVFSFNLFDEHKPFTFRISLDRLAHCTIAELCAGFAEPGRKWAAYVVGCLAILHREKLVDLANSEMRGINFAVYSDVPMNMGLGSSSALTAAAMKNLIEHFGISDAIKIEELCGAVERELAGSLFNSVNQVSLNLPLGFQIIGISSGFWDQKADERIDRHLRTASDAHAMILSKMREMGRAAGRELIDDPMRGQLANLDPDDYKKFFRPYLVGDEILGAADHHVLEARRVRQFCEFIEQAAAMDVNDLQRYTLMDKAGHLMYASHLSYTNDARLGSDECDLLVKLVREREKSGLYGARTTGRGCGGTVAVLCEMGEAPQRALNDISDEYARCLTEGKHEMVISPALITTCAHT